jgi:peroxiredoxin
VRRLLLATLLLASGCASRPSLPPTAPSALLGKSIPDFARPSLDGQRISTARLRGRAVVVKFFADYCAPCKHTLPVVERLHEKYPDFAFIGVSEDERVATAARLVQQFHLTFPVVLDRGNVLAGRFRVSAMPVTFVVDRRGVVRWVGGPAQTEAELAQALAALE